ncbi:TonB family protein (plasmid) [Pseudanabaena biceps]|nr:TonB family protein [Pseudanabaena biceps]
MKISKPADDHLKEENRALASLLFIGFVGSTCVHAAVMITPIPTLWSPVSNELDDTIEVIVDETSTPEEKKSEQEIAEIPKKIEEPEPVNNIEPSQPIEAAPVAIALAPENTVSPKEGKEDAAPDSLKPLITSGVSDTKIQSGGGPIIAKDGIGSGFGNAKIPTGFVLGGKINGNPNGSKNGVINGIINGNPNGKATQTNAILPTIPVPSQSNNNPPPKLECLSCPKPQYRGKEGTPRVTYDIGPDGRVSNVRLRQSSGDAQTDRETLEAMSKWQFNPQTIPEGGRNNVKVRVTFEEEGSKFQRENEDRRRQEAEQLAAQQSEQRRLAEESRQREVELAKPTAVTTPVTPEPVSPSPVINPTLPVEPVTAPTAIEPPTDTSSPVSTPAVDPLPPPPIVDNAPPPPEPPIEPVRDEQENKVPLN